MTFKFCYPGFTRKAVSFTIDDGILQWDKKFLDIVKPFGIKGTFNLCSNKVDPQKRDFFLDFYRGYEIANHCKYHPFALDDSKSYEFLPEREAERATPDPQRLYEISQRPGMYKFLFERGWREIADNDLYIRCADESRAELEEVFGEGTVRSYVWPYCEQNNAAVVEHLRQQGYYGIRKTGDLYDTTGFSLPADWNRWSYNASNRNLLEVMEKYEAYDDGGELKCFVFGVHSWDFERDGNWDDLVEFASKYGNRPKDFWYATVGEIHDYSVAVTRLKGEGEKLVNDSSLELFVELDGGKRISLLPGEEYIA